MARTAGRKGAMSARGDEVSAFRLRRHHLARRARRDALVEVVRDVCGVQSQVMSAAEIALWARVRLTRGEVERALWQDRTLVRTWAMRGASFVLPAADLPVYVGALSRSQVKEDRRWMAHYGLRPADADLMIDAIAAALDDGPMTRRELAGEVTSRVGMMAKRWVGNTWGGVVKQACLRGLVCFGPDRGQESTFVRVDRWLGRPRQPTTAAAEADLLRRYLHAYGPATPRDVAAWSGMAMSEVAPIWERLAGEVVEVVVAGQLAWILQDDLAALRKATFDGPTVRLLPSFDTFMLGHRDKSHLVDEAHYKRVYRKAGWLTPVVLVDGRVVATWSHRRRRSRVVVAVQPFGKIARSVRQRIEEEVTDFGRFLGAAATVTFEESN